MSREFGFLFKYEHYNKDGELVWSQDWSPNQFSDDGFEHMFDLYFRGATAPTGFEIGLTGSAPLQDDSIAQIGTKEIDNATEGYARQGVDRDDTASGFPTLALDGGDMQIESTTVQFENTDGSVAWDGATHAFLTAVMAGDDIFVCWQALSTTRTLQPGDKLNVTIKAKGKQPA